MNFLSYHLASPWAFLLLLLIPFLIYHYKRRSPQAALHLPGLSWLQLHAQNWHTGKRAQLYTYLLWPLRLSALAFMLIALARPQSGITQIEKLSQGVDIVLAIDTSGSMQALDFVVGNKRVDRLSVLKQVASEFIKARDLDRLGLVVFGDQAYTQCPLTLDHRVFGDFLNAAEIGMAGKSTALGTGLATALKRLEKSSTKSKVVILITDGKSNAGNIEPLQAAEIAKGLQVKVYTIGVGSHGEVPFPIETPFGTQLTMQKLDLDEVTLQAIAQTTGGRYFNARDTESLKTIYHEIDQLEKSKIQVKEYRQVHDHFLTFLIPALMLIFSVIILEQSWLRRLP